MTFLEELKAAESTEISKRHDIKAAEIFMLLDLIEKDSKEPKDNSFSAALLAFRLGYARGYKAGQNKEKRKRRMIAAEGATDKAADDVKAVIKAQQAEEIRARYTPEEVQSILKRTKKARLEDLTDLQALRLIAKRETK